MGAAGMGSGGVGAGGVAAGGDGGTGGCYFHEDCGPEARCDRGECTDCVSSEQAPLCPHCGPGQEPIVHSKDGCREVCDCAPFTECIVDADCGPDAICYPGTVCEGDCVEAWCCWGNRCAEPGCDSSDRALPCSMFGCRNGGGCELTCDMDACVCSDGTWLCDPVCISSDVADCSR